MTNSLGWLKQVRDGLKRWSKSTLLLLKICCHSESETGVGTDKGRGTGVSDVLTL